MTGRQKIDAALSASGTPQVPAVICYEGIYFRDHWSQFTDTPWWYAQSPDIDHQFGWRCDAIEMTPQDWFVLPVVLPRAQRESLRIEVESGDVYRMDRRTGRRERLIQPQIGGWVPSRPYSDHVTGSPQTLQEIDAALPMPPEETTRQMLSDGRGDLATLLLARYGPHLWPLCHISSPLWSCYSLWGFEGMMTRIADAPELIHYACSRLLERVKHRIREAATIGAAGIWIEECFTDMVSPDVFAAINVPLIRHIVQDIRAAGMKSIYYYCGDPAGRWDLILSTGADAISLEESKKGFTIDIEEIVRRSAGRCAVLGNLDAIGILPHADQAHLQREIARQIAAGRRNGGRFVMSLGSPVTPGTSVQRVQQYCNTVRELGMSLQA